MANVRDVARYLLSLSQESTPYAITPLKLQKLVYYAQGYHLFEEEAPLFEDANIEAWEHGPVVPLLYQDYRDFGYFTIPKVEFNNENGVLTEEEIQTIEKVWKEYGRFDGKFLEELTHQEDPWLFTKRNGIITNNIIRTYFNETLQSV